MNMNKCFDRVSWPAGGRHVNLAFFCFFKFKQYGSSYHTPTRPLILLFRSFLSCSLGFDLGPVPVFLILGYRPIRCILVHSCAIIELEIISPVLVVDRRSFLYCCHLIFLVLSFKFSSSSSSPRVFIVIFQ